MPNSIVILRKVFKIDGNPISRSKYKFLAFFLFWKKTPYVVSRDVCPSVRLSFEEKTLGNSSEH